MGIPCRTLIDKSDLGWRCHKCDSHLAKKSNYIPGDFTGKTGAALFLKRVINVDRGPPETQKMTSGSYVVQHISCKFCQQYLGWTYVKAFQKDCRYKEGKFCLEMKQISSNGFVCH